MRNAGWLKACLVAYFVALVSSLTANITKRSDPYPTICMGELGCFPITEDFIHHYYRPINFTPWPRDKIKTKLLLFTKHNKQNAYQMFAWNRKNFALSSFNRRLPVKVIIPGWLDSRVTAKWFRRLKDTFIEMGDYNVIVVEWENVIPYLMATMNTRVVGAEVANLINFLLEDVGAHAEQFHLIGHSLGAHICGYAGKRVPNLGRITALDAARPFFQGMPSTVRLHKTDANFVDVIHSDTNPVLPVGYKEPFGHVDFYPNGASPQPGCFVRDRVFRGLEDGLFDGRITTVFLQAIRYNTLCSHQLSHKWFTKSVINSHSGCQFTGVKCGDYKDFVDGYCTCDDSPEACAVMGLKAESTFYAGLHERSQEQKWFLKASGREPFCLYQYQVVLQLTPATDGLTLKGSMSLTFNYYSSEKGTSDVFEVSLFPPHHDLSPGLRLPYVVTSNEPLGDIHSIYFSWTSLESDSSKDISHPYHFGNHLSPILYLQYIRITPVEAHYGRKYPLTKYYCNPGEYRSAGLESFRTVLLTTSAC